MLAAFRSKFEKPDRDVSTILRIEHQNRIDRLAVAFIFELEIPLPLLLLPAMTDSTL